MKKLVTIIGFLSIPFMTFASTNFLVILDKEGNNVATSRDTQLFVDGNITSISDDGRVLLEAGHHILEIRNQDLNMTACILTNPWSYNHKADLPPYYSFDEKVIYNTPILTLDLRNANQYPCK